MNDLRSRVADEGRGHLETTGSNVTEASQLMALAVLHDVGCLPLSSGDVSGDPFDKVGRVLALKKSAQSSIPCGIGLTWTVWICSSISFIETFPRK